MSKTARFIPALGAVLLVVIGLSACGGIPSGSVVQIDGKPLTDATFKHWLAVAAAATAASAEGTPAKAVLPEPPKYTACIAHLQATQPAPAKGTTAPSPAQLKAQCEQQYKTLLPEVLSFLISSQWVLSEANSLGVHVSDKEVRKRFNQIREQQFPKPAEFEKFLASSGQTVSDLLLRVKLNLLSSKIQQKITKEKSHVTQAQVAKYYNEHKTRFEVPPKRNINLILTKTEAQANKAKSEVSSGKSFATVAKSVSIDPVTKARGGNLPEVVKGQEEQALDQAIFSAKANTLSGPVKTPFGYYIFEVKGVTPGSVQPLAQAQSSVKSQLVATQQQAALASFVKGFKTRWTAKTDCRTTYYGAPLASVVVDCKQYKAPRTGVTK